MKYKVVKGKKGGEMWKGEVMRQQNEGKMERKAME